MEDFNSTFNKYIEKKDKFDSLYIFVLYNATQEMLDEKIKKLYNILDCINDVKKRGFLKSRIFDFRKYVSDNYNLEDKIDSIFMISENVKEEVLTKYHKDTLLMFSHNNCSYDFGSNYPIEWLKHLITNRDYIHVITVKGNDIDHLMLNKTKKKYLYKDTIKSMDLKLIISEKIPKGENYIIHGSSVVLKNYIDANAVTVNQKELNDDEIFKIVDLKKYQKNGLELTELLANMTNPKVKTRLVFGKDIQKCIKNNLLKTLFCSPIIADKVNDKIPKDLMIFDVKIVKSIDKGDIGDELEKNYSGSIGIMMYDIDLDNL